MSPLSSPEVEERLSSHPISPTVATPEVPKASDRTQVEAKEVRLSDMPPVTLVDNNVHTKTDDIAEMNIAEDLDNRPSKKAKISESGVLEPSSMSPTMSASTPVSECSESIVPESDNQIDHDPLQSPPSPSSSTLSPVLTLHDVKEPDSNKEIKVDETYDYLPQATQHMPTPPLQPSWNIFQAGFEDKQFCFNLEYDDELLVSIKFRMNYHCVLPI